MFISERIRAIGDFITSEDKVADVGADHGLLELHLLAKYKNIQILAIENKIGPYKILDERLRAFNGVRLSLSDGLVALDRIMNCLVIAGMGGYNIRDILLARPDKLSRIKKIIIDAHRDGEVARETIVNLGYRIEEEKIIYEQEKYYVISKFIKDKNHPTYSEDEIAFGYKLFNDKLWPKYKEFLIDKNNKTINIIKDLENEQDKVLSLKKLNQRIENYGKN